MTRPIVVNIKAGEQFDVFIGRPSKWGNPFFPKDGSREAAIEKYRAWIVLRPELIAALPELAGKRMGCFCAPQSCHGDVLVELVGALPESGEAER